MWAVYILDGPLEVLLDVPGKRGRKGVDDIKNRANIEKETRAEG